MTLLLIPLKYFLLCTLALSMAHALYSQQDSVRNDTEWSPPFFIDLETEKIDSEENLDLMEELIIQEEGTKWNINQLSQDVALNLLQMTDYQYYHLLRYIDQFGPLVTIYELAAVEGFSQKEVMRWAPYLVVEPPKPEGSSWKGFFKRSKNQLIIRSGRILEAQQKEDQGSPDKLAFKYSFETLNRFSWAFSGEKDPGEKLFRGEQKQGFDFYSGHLQVKNWGLLKKLILGDYRLEMGQGLVLGSSYLQGSGMGVRKTGSTLRATAAMNEVPLIRGVALELGNYRCWGTLFGGERHNAEGFMGYLAGAELYWQTRLLRVGARWIYAWYQPPITTAGRWYQHFYFQGEEIWNGSVDYRILLRKSTLFGELAISQGGGVGMIQGAIIPLHPLFKSLIMVRHYGSRFHSIAGNGFSQNSVLQNEQGIYWASQIVVGRSMEWELFADLFRINWLKYQLDKPEPQLHLGVLVKWQLARYHWLTVQYRYKTKSRNRKTGFYNEIYTKYTHRLRVIAQLEPYTFLSLKTECSFSWIGDQIPQESSNPVTRGVLVYQDLKLKWEAIKMEWTGRVAYFDTDSYEDRLYAYENDLSYYFTIQSYYNKGFRCYLIWKYQWKAFRFQFRISRTIFDDKEVITIGLDQVKGNHKTEVKGQMIIKF